MACYRLILAYSSLKKKGKASTMAGQWLGPLPHS